MRALEMRLEGHCPVDHYLDLCASPKLRIKTLQLIHSKVSPLELERIMSLSIGLETFIYESNGYALRFKQL
jgi:hypothetical protein